MRTLNRFVVWVGLSTVAFLVGDEIVGPDRDLRPRVDRALRTRVRLPERHRLRFILAYYSAHLGRTLLAFGNGRRPGAFELAVPVAGIVAALIAMAILPNVDLSKP